MDIKKLVPIDFSRKITPLVEGDLIWDESDKNEFIVQADSCLPSGICGFSYLYVISYADRPNTGKQPVDDDVIVTINDDIFSPLTNSKAIEWSATGSNRTWRPNHEEVVKSYQASLAKTEDDTPRIPTSVDSELTRLVDFLYVNNLVITDENPVDCVIRELAEKHDIDIRSDEKS